MRDRLLYKIFKLRGNQIGRACKQAGWFPVIFLSLLMATFIVQCAFYFPAKPYLFLPFYLLLSIPIHRRRWDRLFLQKLNQPKEHILLAEYNVLVLPLTLILACHLNIGLILAGHFLTSMVAFIPFRNVSPKRHFHNSWVRWIPNKLFEWRCFFRSHRFLWLFFYVPALVFSFYTFIVPLALLIFLIFLPEIFNYAEPKEVIQFYPQENSFLWSKIYDHSVFVHVLLAPLYVLFLLFHAPMWYILATLVVLVECSLCFGLTYKYAHFIHASPHVHNQLPFLMFYAMMILFFPAGLFFIYRYWRKATIEPSYYA